MRYSTLCPGSSKVVFCLTVAEFMLIRRCEQLFEQLYAQKDFDFMQCWKEIDTTSSGFLTKSNIQTFFANIGIVHPKIHEWIFKRFAPYDKSRLDINDFRKIFDCLGNGILGLNEENSEYGIWQLRRN